MDIASHERFAPVLLCELGTARGPVSYLCNELERSPGLRTQGLVFLSKSQAMFSAQAIE